MAGLFEEGVAGAFERGVELLAAHGFRHVFGGGAVEGDSAVAELIDAGFVVGDVP